MTPERVENLIASDPGFWGRKRKMVLVIVAKYLDSDNVLTPKKLDQVIAELRNGRKKCRKDLLRTLERVLDRLARSNLISSNPLQVKKLPPRPSVLPAKPQHIALLDGITRIVDTVWTTDFNAVSSPAHSAAALHVLLVTSAGLSGSAAEEVLTELKWADLKDPNPVHCKIHPKDTSERRSLLSLPADVELLTRVLFRRREPGASGDYVFLPANTDSGSRANRVSTFLRAAYADLVQLTRESFPTERYPTYRQFATVGPLLAILNGLEPLFSTIASIRPLPTSHPSDSELVLESGENLTPSLAYSRLLCGEHTLISEDTMTQFNPETPDDSSKSAGKQWCKRARRIVRRIWNGFKALDARAFSTDELNRRRLQVLQDLRHEANDLAPPTSAIHLALDWAAHTVKQKHWASSTYCAYLSRVFTGGLLNDCPEARDLSNWDSEDHEELLEALYYETENPSTRESLLTAIRSVYAFAATHGYADDVQLDGIIGEWNGGTTRHELIGLWEFDRLIEELLSDASRDSATLAVAALLGYWGGLRAIEVVRLHLSDIFWDGENLYVHIYKSKTPSSRRRVPLSMLAPKAVCEQIGTFVSQRRAEFPEDAILDSIAMFGPTGSRPGYSRKVLIDALIPRLKNAFGEKTVFHTLRHCFASWLMVRWYAARYPDFVDSLYERYHPSVGKELLRNIAVLFTLVEQDTIPISSTSDMVTLTKLMGHLGQRTLLEVYVHTFHFLHRHAMQRMSAKTGGRRLSSRQIALLLPNMKSRTSQARIKDKTINGVVAYLAGLSTSKNKS